MPEEADFLVGAQIQTKDNISDLNLKYNSSDSDEPVKSTKSPENEQIEEEKTSIQISIYDEECLYLSPQFIVHPNKFRMLSLKLSLENFIRNGRDLSTLLISVINRQNNKKTVVKLAQDLILQKKLSLIGISKFFTKLN